MMKKDANQCTLHWIQNNIILTHVKWEFDAYGLQITAHSATNSLSDHPFRYSHNYFRPISNNPKIPIGHTNVKNSGATIAQIEK